MAGKRQHYIPQFLQRGFLADHPLAAEHTWLHRRGASPKLVGIRNVGVEEFFYSRPSSNGKITLDDKITAYEESISSALRTVRALDIEDQVDATVAAELIAHLTIRTAHIRAGMSNAISLLLDELSKRISDSELMREELGLGELSSRQFESRAREQTAALSEGLQMPPALARRSLTFFARERFDDLYGDVRPALDQLIGNLQEGLSDAIRDAHNRALSSFEIGERERQLSRFSWRKHAVYGALLPDCIAMARELEGGYVPLLLGNVEASDLVILPLSHNQLLVGSRGTPEDIDISVVNEASSKCSDNFFISSKESDGATLIHLLGQRCADAISRHVRSASTPKDARNPPKESSRLDWRVEHPVEKLQFSVRCEGFGDQNTVAIVGMILKTIVAEVSRSMPLLRLDGFTFSSDYSTTLKQLDRGDPNLPPDHSQAREYGRAVSKCVRVVRNGQLKEHIVFDAIIAYDLLKEESETHADSLHVVVGMLSHVAHGTLYEENPPGEPADDTERLLHQCVSTVPCMYFSARQSAFANPAAGERYAALMMDSYKTACEAIQSARLAYWTHKNVDFLLEVALPRIGFVLEHAAQWLGHRDGLPSEDEFPGAALMDHLKLFDLDHWLELFGRDLRRLYSDNENLTAANVFALGRHAERLLWTVKLFPWPMNDGRTFISVIRDQ